MGNGERCASAKYHGGEFRESRELEQVHLILGFRGVGLHDPDYYALSVLSNLLGGGMSSRLFQEIREKRGLVYSIYSFSLSYSDEGLFGVYAGTGENTTGELIPVLCNELNCVANTVDDDEVARSRVQLKAGLLMGMESTGARSEQLAQHILQFGRPLSVEELTQKVDAVDLAAIRRVAAKILSSEPTFAALGSLEQVEPLDLIARRFS